jgi:hypothetical protein
MTPCYNKHGCGAGGTLRRMKLVLKEPTGGGKMCPAWATKAISDGGEEVPKKVETAACNLPRCHHGTPAPTSSPAPTPAPTLYASCVVSAWALRESCSKSCGGGLQLSTRRITTYPEAGGRACPALFRRTRCNLKPCAHDCELSSWTAWGGCSAKCGHGHRRRERKVLMQPQVRKCASTRYTALGTLHSFAR